MIGRDGEENWDDDKGYRVIEGGEDYDYDVKLGGFRDEEDWNDDERLGETLKDMD